MGSGVLLAILVALWFVVLVPMVVTRGDLASAPAEPMRVLRRRSERSAMSSASMSSRDRLLAGRPARSAPSEPDHMRTEPIPVLPRRVPGATLTSESRSVGSETPKDVRPGNAKGVRAENAKAARVEPAKGKKRSTEAPVKDQVARSGPDLRARRRRMLAGLVVVAVLFAGMAKFWETALWWPQIVLDLAVFSYVVFLRMEAQREQDRRERRLARAVAKVKLPEDRTERAVRRHTEYEAHITAATGNQAIALDDDDPSFADMPTYRPSANVVSEAPAWHERKAV